MPPFAFTSEQLDRVMDAASMLPANAQPSFVRSVANRVADLPYTVGTAEIEVAIRFVLGTRGVTGGFAAFTNKTTDQVAPRARAERQFARR